MQRPLIGLITEECKVSRWQAEALEQLGPGFDYLVLDCTAPRSRKKPFAHAFYYALNLASLKPSAGPAAPLPKSLPIVKTIAFEAEQDVECGRNGAADSRHHLCLNVGGKSGGISRKHKTRSVGRGGGCRRNGGNRLRRV